MTKEKAVSLLSQMFLIQFSKEEHEALAMAIDALNADRKTEPKQEWIPCSERLPSDGQCVIIQYFDTVGKNHISVVGAYYNERQGFVDTGYGEMWFGNGNDDVLAWMPLPKPWKGTDDEID